MTQLRLINKITKASKQKHQVESKESCKLYNKVLLRFLSSHLEYKISRIKMLKRLFLQVR